MDKELWIVYLQEIFVDLIFTTEEDANEFVKSDLECGEYEPKDYRIVKYVRA